MIPHKDRLPQLRWTLRALKTQHTTEPYEVIVVDDGSDQRPEDHLMPSDLPKQTRFLNQRNTGAAEARNAGWKAAAHDIVVFLDCDQIVSPNFLKNHLIPFRTIPEPFMQLGTRRHLRTLDIQSVGHARNANCLPDERLFFMRQTSFNFANLEIAWHLGFSHNMTFRRVDLERIGGFDKKFIGWGFEDCELTYRMKNAGVPPVLNATVEACHQLHPQRMTPQKFERWMQNLTYFMQKHPTPEVESQKELIAACDPDHQPRLKWTKALIAMERRMRAHQNREMDALPVHAVACETLADLYAIAKAPDCALTKAIVDPSNIALFAQAQLDPALRNLRLSVN